MGLTPRRQRFVDEYLIDLNGSAAAQRAGYRRHRGSTHRLMRAPAVRAAIAEGLAKQAARAHVTADAVITELARIGFSNILDYMRVGQDGDLCVDLTGLDRARAAAIAEVTVEDFRDGRTKDARECRRVKFKLLDKRAALVDLGKHLGMFKERVEHTGPDGDPITITRIELAGPEE